MLIANKATFKGIFPHKGQPCAKFVNQQGITWFPCHDRKVILAETIEEGQGYLPGTVLTQESLEQIPAYDWALVYPAKYPDLVFTLNGEFDVETWKLSGSIYHRLLPGNKVKYAGGLPTQWYVW